MECNFDLIRDLLLRLERRKPRESWLDLAINGHEQDLMANHIDLLKRSGFLTAPGSPSSAGPDWDSLQLTPKGQEFLDIARNEMLWTTVKGTVRANKEKVSLEQFSAALFAAAQDLFG